VALEFARKLIGLLAEEGRMKHLLARGKKEAGVKRGPNRSRAGQMAGPRLILGKREPGNTTPQSRTDDNL